MGIMGVKMLITVILRWLGHITRRKGDEHMLKMGIMGVKMLITVILRWLGHITRRKGDEQIRKYMKMFGVGMPKERPRIVSIVQLSNLVLN